MRIQDLRDAGYIASTYENGKVEVLEDGLLVSMATCFASSSRFVTWQSLDQARYPSSLVIDQFNDMHEELWTMDHKLLPGETKARRLIPPERARSILGAKLEEGPLKGISVLASSDLLRKKVVTQYEDTVIRHLMKSMPQTASYASTLAFLAKPYDKDDPVRRGKVEDATQHLTTTLE